MLNFNKESLQDEGVESHDYFNVTHDRAIELEEVGLPIVHRFQASEITSGEFTDLLINCGETDNEKCYLALTSGLFIGEAIAINQEA